MQIGIGTQLINRDTRCQATITDRQTVTDTWNGGTLTMYLIDGRWLKPLEVSALYVVIGDEPLPVDDSW